MDFLEEYSDFRAIPRNTAITYKFFDLFKVSKEENWYYTISWGKVAKCDVNDNEAGTIKAFLKATKAGLRDGEYDASECSRRMWFFYNKLIEIGAFKTEERMEILKWMDVCQWVIT